MTGSSIFKRLFLLGLLVILIGLYLFWSYLYPPIPESLRQTLFEGIGYIRDVRNMPRPVIIHVVSVDLDNKNIRFLVTPGESVEEGEIGARTTSQFLAEFNLQVAVNGSFFYPFRPISIKFWEAYPAHRGDPVYVVGFASSDGQVYSEATKNFDTFYISADNQAQFQAPIGAVYHAISGRELFVIEGKVQGPFSGAFNDIPYPRSALALDKAAKTLMIFVVDGKQKDYSEGVTLVELAEIVQAYGGYRALVLDGGGSSTLVMEGPSGNAVLLNSPINGRIRGNERLVANHFGVFVNRQ